MEQLEAMQLRHSVRQYDPRPLEEGVRAALEQEAARCNQESGLHIQLVTNEPQAFTGFLAKYGKFQGVTNYFALVGQRGDHLDETCGYYGERLVLASQALGLNTCWVGLTYRKTKGAFQVGPGEKLVMVIAVGYGKTMGVSHRSKAPEEVSNISDDTPEWFRRGVEAALLAPTAMNQQKFFFTYHKDGRVTAEKGRGSYSKVDLGIAKYHFALGAGRPCE